MEIVGSTKCVSAPYVFTGRGTVSPLHSTTFSHPVIENKHVASLVGFGLSNGITRTRCDPAQYFKYEDMILRCLVCVYAPADLLSK